MPRVMQLAGQVFGRLTVIERAPNKPYTENSVWRCRCECGNFTDVVGIKLVGKNTKSCGCWRVEDTGRRARIHGLSGSRTFHAWAAAKQRCHNPNARWYPRYGGRGILMCQEWRGSFSAFLRDMGEAPSDRHSIDRIDNARGYEPGNCRWATHIEQANNKRNSRFITFGGETRTVTEWERHLGLPPGRAKYRLYHGWSVERALLTPPRRGRRP